MKQTIQLKLTAKCSTKYKSVFHKKKRFEYFKLLKKLDVFLRKLKWEPLFSEIKYMNMQKTKTR